MIILTDRCNQTDSFENGAVKLNRDLTQRLTIRGDRRHKHFSPLGGYETRGTLWKEVDMSPN